MHRACLSLLLFLTIVISSFAQSKKPNKTKVVPLSPAGIKAEGSFIYTYVDDQHRRRMSAEVFRPTNTTEPAPVIVMFFGGGWQNGRPALFVPLAQHLSLRGYVTVIPNYRLSGEAPFPAAVHDCKAAIRWVRANAKRFNADANKISVLGGSAGGHLSAFLAATNGDPQFEGKGDHQKFSSEVQAAIVMCGPVNMLNQGIVDRVEAGATSKEGDAILDFMGGVPPSVDDTIYRLASPITHLDQDMPPALFIDGELDNPRLRYTDFWKKMDVLGIHHDFVLMPKAPHPFWVSEEWFHPTVEAVDMFLKKTLRY
ncbi:alpha/beta hydrolase [Verrucomicrobia bacterium]|nr:alpha/beta hydrolase [Verrucomicrobiota bacterium]